MLAAGLPFEELLLRGFLDAPPIKAEDVDDDLLARHNHLNKIMIFTISRELTYSPGTSAPLGPSRTTTPARARAATATLPCPWPRTPFRIGDGGRISHAGHALYFSSFHSPSLFVMLLYFYQHHYDHLPVSSYGM